MIKIIEYGKSTIFDKFVKENCKPKTKFNKAEL